MSRSDAEQEDKINAERMPSFDDVRWTSCSLEAFTDLYWDEIAPASKQRVSIREVRSRPTSGFGITMRGHSSRLSVAITTAHSESSGTKTLSSVTMKRDTHGKQRMMQQSTPSNSSSAGGNHDTVWRRLLSTHSERD